MTKTSRTSDSVQVRFAIFWEVEVDDNIDRLNVDTSCEEIRRYKMSCSAIAKLVKDTVAIRLLHLGVDVVARVS